MGNSSFVVKVPGKRPGALRIQPEEENGVTTPSSEYSKKPTDKTSKLPVSWSL